MTSVPLESALVELGREIHRACRYPPLVADWNTVREIPSSLPDADESTTHGRPALKVGGKLFAWMSPDRAAEGALAVRVDPDEEQLLLESRSHVCFVTPHYDGYPIVLIRLEKVEPCELAELIEDAWLLRAPKRLAAAYLEASST